MTPPAELRASLRLSRRTLDRFARQGPEAWRTICAAAAAQVTVDLAELDATAIDTPIA